MSQRGKPYAPAKLRSAEQLAAEMREMIATAVVRRTWAPGRVGATGAKALVSLVKSQSLIKVLHQHVADMLHSVGGVADHRIRFELTLPTPFDGKNEDVVVIPAGCERTLGEQVIAVGVRSQLSSVGKNRKNILGLTRNEATDFHEVHPAQVVAHVFVLALNEVDKKLAGDDVLGWRRAPNIARTIDWYSRIGGRKDPDSLHQLTERVGLLIVDMAPKTPKVYRSVAALVRDGWVSKAQVRKYGLSLDGLLLDDEFVHDLLEVHRRRFPSARLN